MKSKTLRHCLATGIVLAASLSLTAVAHAKDGTTPRIQATTETKVSRTATDSEQRAISVAGGRILVHVDRARHNLMDKNKEEAKSELDQALKLVRIIKNAAPKYKTTTDITSGDEHYESDIEFTPRYVTLAADQYVDDIISPVAQAKAKKRSGRYVKATGQTSDDKAVADASFVTYETISLDLIAADRLLTGAMSDITSGDLTVANTKLESLQDNAVLISADTVELPLLEAASNLDLARIELGKGNEMAALETLTKASARLKAYEKIAGNSKAKEVNALHHEIDELTKQLESESDLKSAMKKADKKISEWWRRALSWYDKK